ncbi:McrC family protein [Thalassotalea sp. LPB0316]|uniref:McrC family protein n=1 Tax=Thalassotalea sp. LPB0316 TaxID=2769490 RepID=UPI001D03A6AE|nr:McrC family protein [Thalassotalea sp. LPB0316]
MQKHLSVFMNNPTTFAKDIVIKEYGLLLNGGNSQDIGCRSISSKAFNWLLLNGQSIGENGRELIKVKRRGNGIALQVVNFVGVVETPCGTRIEILPKVTRDSDDTELARKTLLKMLSVVEKIKLEQFYNSSLKIINQPLLEVLITLFLEETSKLIKKGIRSHYRRTERESPFLKGQLLTAKQIRQRPGRQHYFQVSHDIFTADRAENRLLHSALYQVFKWTKSPNNQRLARELLFVFHDIRKSADYCSDFRKWSDDRTLAHYRDIKVWCRLILSYQSPITLAGQANGVSFLFPMEVLFERYVAAKLKSRFESPLRLSEQTQSKALTEHKEQNWFKLRPDIVIYHDKKVVSVMDTKWKVINQNLATGKDKYNLAQSDMYQLFAYGEKYLNGSGDMFLIYPKHENFDSALEEFSFKPSLRLNVIPYDLVTDQCQISIGVNEHC